jgi:hypothetical protein
MMSKEGNKVGAWRRPREAPTCVLSWPTSKDTWVVLLCLEDHTPVKSPTFVIKRNDCVNLMEHKISM